MVPREKGSACAFGQRLDVLLDRGARAIVALNGVPAYMAGLMVVDLINYLQVCGTQSDVFVTGQHRQLLVIWDAPWRLQ